MRAASTRLVTDRFCSLPLVGACLLLAALSPLTVVADDSEPPTPVEYLSVTGGYVEVRAVDVDPARLLRVPEIGPVGEVAILGWKIRDGRWAGQDLSGLQIAAAVCARRQQIDDALERGGAVHSVVFVDDGASRDQTRALVSLIKKLTERKLGKVIEVRPTSLSLEITETEEHQDDADGEEAEHGSHETVGTMTLEIPNVLRLTAEVESEEDAACGAVCGGHGQNSTEELHSSLSRTEKRFHANTTEYSVLGASRGPGVAGGTSSKAAVVGAFSL